MNEYALFKSEKNIFQFYYTTKNKFFNIGHSKVNALVHGRYIIFHVVEMATSLSVLSKVGHNHVHSVQRVWGNIFRKSLSVQEGFLQKLKDVYNRIHQKN